jgi:uncharacterized surface protein with fasciclin (FAS1) repeats
MTSSRIAITLAALVSSLAVAACGAGDADADLGQRRDELRAQSPNIVQVALTLNAPGSPYEGQFDTLVAAVLAADPAVLRTLTAPGKRTVFAPTDEAFAKLDLDPSTVGGLEVGFLTDVLTYHVVQGERLASDVVSADRMRSLQGTFFFPSADATLTDAVGRVATIIATDVMAANGVIHAIDTVILPYAP